MKRNLPDSPVKAALLSALGSLIACTAFLAPWPRMHHSDWFGAYAILCLVVFAFGAFFSLTFVGKLKQGIENKRWPEAQIEPLRAHLHSQYYTALSIGLLIAFFIFEIFLKRRFGGLGWGCFILSQTISQLRIALKRLPPSIPPIQWRTSAPIHSDHWGNR